MRSAVALLLTIAAPAWAAPPPGFADRVDALRRQVGVPGMAVAIVEQGVPTLVRGFGVRRLGAPDPVDADTIFMTGSTGKAFTSAALATLVDAGKLDWDDRVVDRLPGFQMYDPWVTREITIRDILVHRSGLGLGEGDLLFVPRSNLSRAETVKRLRYLKPATSFRSGYAYDNVLYMVAGAVIEAVSGQTWERYVRDHVLRPAGMMRSATDAATRFATADRAFPHARTAGPIRGVGVQAVLDERDELGRNAAPAGGLAISANDMAKWLAVQLAHGALPDGTRLFSEAAHDAMWQPETLQPISLAPSPIAETTPKFSAYALGWDVRDYRGAKIVMHEGAVLGMESIVVLMPEQNTGFAIEINSEDGEVLLGLAYELMDHYLGTERKVWPERFARYKAARQAAATTLLATRQAAPAAAGPSLPLARYAGIYHDAWYGDIRVDAGRDGLTIDFTATPRMAGPLTHFQYDTFTAHFSDRTIEPAYVTFAIDAEGRVAGVTMKPVSPLADFSYDYQDLHFTPAAAKQP